MANLSLPARLILALAYTLALAFLVNTWTDVWIGADNEVERALEPARRLVVAWQLLVAASLLLFLARRRMMSWSRCIAVITSGIVSTTTAVVVVVLVRVDISHQAKWYGAIGAAVVGLAALLLMFAESGWGHKRAAVPDTSPGRVG